MSGGVLGYFSDERALLAAAHRVYEAGYRRFDTLSPFPVHGMDEAMGLKRSPLPWVTFIAGVLGCAFGLWFQWWTSAVNWPLNIGGKPFFSLPAFIPIVFEVTVLFAGLASFGAVLVFCRLPQVNPPILDEDFTDHKFALFIPKEDAKFSDVESGRFLESLGATNVRKYERF